MAKNEVTHDIGWVSLLRILALGVGIWAVITLSQVIFFMIVVFIFVAAVNPTIAYLQRYMSRALAVTFFFVTLLLVLGGLLWAFVPVLVRQIGELITVYPTLFERVSPYLTESQASAYSSFVGHISTSINTTLEHLSGDVIARGTSFFGGFLTFITGLVISFYLLLEEKNAKEFFHQVLPRHRFQAVYTTVQKISEKMGYWIRGQVVLMLIIAVANFIAYLAIGLPTPLPLALWNGLCEAIPYVGPVLGVIPAFVIALVKGNFLAAALVLVAGFVIQQLESSFIVPRVMSRAIGLSPVLVILALVTGGQLFGIFGAVIAVPAAAIISVIVQEWPRLRKLWETNEATS